MKKFSIVFVVFALMLCACDIDPYENERPYDYPNSYWVCQEYNAFFSVDYEGHLAKSQILLGGNQVPFEFLWSALDNKVTITFEINANKGSLFGECEFSEKKLVIKIENAQDYFDKKSVVLTFIRQDN